MLTSKAKRNYAQRCVIVFSNVNQTLRMELGDIIAKHGAEGILQSGATIRRSISAFERHNLQGLESLEQEFSRLIQSRGREWKLAMDAVEVAIDGQMKSARTLLERPFRLAAGSVGEPAPAGSSIANAIDDELREVKARLFERHRAFREGWTAPIGRPWHERHPVLYAAIAAIGGALLAWSVGGLAGPG